jgi:cobyrinic acid a,c-diamide synthase
LKGFVIAGTNSGVGKTTISIGIMKALKKRGLEVAPFKVGPDYIDTGFHSFVTNTPSHNIDLIMAGENTSKALFNKHLKGKDIAVVEGVMGLFDGLNFNLNNGSTGHISKTLGLPVVLIIKPKGIGGSILAQIKGYLDYDEEVEIKGIILNETSKSLYKYYKEPIEERLGIKCIGHIPKEEGIYLGSRHLGLITAHETEDLEVKIEKAAKLVEKYIDLDYLANLQIKEIEFLYNNHLKNKIKKLRKDSEGINLGYAYDEAFNFYYNDNLELLEELGINLIKFSPLKDEKLDPKLDGIYLGGGFPEIYAEKLASNVSMKKSIKERLDKGMFAYGECGGFMYLCRNVSNLEDIQYNMVNFFKFDVEMTKKLNRFGYIEVDFSNGKKTIGHEFHRSKVVNSDLYDDFHFEYKVKKIRNREKWKEGYSKKNVRAGYPHIHFYSNLDLLENLLIKINRSREK